MSINGKLSIPRADLGAAVLEAQPSEANFIGSQVLLPIDSALKQGTFPALKRGTLTTIENTSRAPRAAYSRGQFEIREDDFNCTEDGHEEPLDDVEAKFFGNYFEAEMFTSKKAWNVLMLSKEYKIAQTVFNTSTWSGADLYTDNTSKPWSDPTTHIIDQTKAAIAKVEKNVGFSPNRLIVSKVTWDNMCRNEVVMDRIKGAAVITQDLLRQVMSSMLDIEEIVIGKATFNTANENKPAKMQYIWSDKFAMVAKVATNRRDFSDPAIGRQIIWTADSDENVAIEQYREENIRSTVYRAREHKDLKIVEPYMGHLMKIG